MKETKKKFENIQDLFNPNNYLTGYIDVQQGDNYGQLLLTHINNMKCKEQIIYSTPKMHYPFNKHGAFYFKELEDTISTYNKIDGTNIISYKYIYRKKEYLTFKTRLNPILNNSKFGNFFKMWKEILEKYPEIIEIATEEDVNLSFELYGVLNKHLILYPTRLDTKLLFALNRYTGDIIPPEKYKNELPIVDKYCDIKKGIYFPNYYKKIVDDIEFTNDYSNKDEIKGLEGCVLYIKDNEGKYKQWKAKPKTIFELHTKGGMSKNSIATTCYNALENVSLDELNYDFVAELLKEEYTETEIQRNEFRIKDILQLVKEEVVKRNNIIETYQKLNLSLKENKNTLMREMSKYFNKKDMRYIYSILEAYEGE